MAEPFIEYGAYYDLLYRDKDYAAEADYVAGALRHDGASVTELLEFGSGTGRHAVQVAQWIAPTGTLDTPAFGDIPEDDHDARHPSVRALNRRGAVVHRDFLTAF